MPVIESPHLPETLTETDSLEREAIRDQDEQANAPQLETPMVEPDPIGVGANAVVENEEPSDLLVQKIIQKMNRLQQSGRG